MEAISHIPISFAEGRSVKARTLYPETEDPISVTFVKSNWVVNPATYHVIIEYGDMDQTDYEYLDTEQIKVKFGFDITQEPVPHAVLMNREEIINTPNDQELGKKVRTQANLI